MVGEKVLELSAGDSSTVLAEGSRIPSLRGIDVVDLLSGRLLGPLMTTLTSIAEDMRAFTYALNQQGVSTSLSQLLARMTTLAEELPTLLQNVNHMSREMAKLAGDLNEQERLLNSLRGLQHITEQLNQMLPVLVENMPEIAPRLPVLIKNLSEMSSELHKLTPAMAEIAPQIPRASQQAIQAIEEAVVTMKALQKSFVLRGKVKQVREEMQAE
ncbi:MAG: hypothetical protein CSA54_02550 [Gammaproteobacteria bacterium]|nr:MAG: hypothetical protein CSA54_02550 [Gammaproteobacteria bacterium]